MSSGLFVITHKEVKNIFPKDRLIMLVNSEDKTLQRGYVGDCACEDNISQKNPSFCELTGLYAMAQTEYDVLGLEHYRRVFAKRKLFLFKYPFLKEKDIQKLLTSYDLILPKKASLDETVYEHYVKNHIKDDLDKTIQIVKQKYPDYVDALDEVMKSKELYFLNMFIGKTDVIREYSKWLFDILFELEKQINIEDRNTYQKRVFGFLSERLFNAWIKKHSELKIVEKPVILLESSVLKTHMRRLKHIFKKESNQES